MIHQNRRQGFDGKYSSYCISLIFILLIAAFMIVRGISNKLHKFVLIDIDWEEMGERAECSSCVTFYLWVGWHACVDESFENVLDIVGDAEDRPCLLIWFFSFLSESL